MAHQLTLEIPDEVYQPLLQKAQPKPQQIQLFDDIRADPGVFIISVDAGLEAAAWQLWRTRPDKEWSLIDCTSFIRMQRRGLTEALTTDRHFEQAGFVRLLK